MKTADTEQDFLSTIPAKDGYFCLDVIEGVDDKLEVGRESIVAWVVYQNIDRTEKAPVCPYVFGHLIPVTVEGNFSNDDEYSVLCPDGKVVVSESQVWGSEDHWFEEQIRKRPSRG